ncbi:MAG: cyclopropane-fatty-acyl-phospholipid synthase family protein [Vicinamibacterales bacterium]
MPAPEPTPSVVPSARETESATPRGRTGRLPPGGSLGRPGASSSTRLDRWVLGRLAGIFAGAPIQLVLWDGTTATLGRSPMAAIGIADRRTLRDLVLRPEIGFGEAYADGRLTVHGDLEGTLETVFRHMAGRWPRPILPHRATGASRSAARHNVHAHYDLGNDFYRLWLDDAMVYTCAYYERPDASLEDAQTAKLDHVCRKLRLRPGEHVIEAGSGWGALAIHMARHYGVTVRAYNISEAQLEYSRARAWREGLAGRVEFVAGDYREIRGRCDAFVSVGMVEHVGVRRYRELGEVIARAIHPGHGRGLLHFIGRNYPARFSPWIERYVFPGAYAPALSEVLPRALEPFDLAVEDVENLRLHYAFTLAEWLARFERHAREIAEMFDERFVRMWRLYLASAQASFASGDLQLFQVLFRRPLDGDAPSTRRAFYQDPPA